MVAGGNLPLLLPAYHGPPCPLLRGHRLTGAEAVGTVHTWFGQTRKAEPQSLCVSFRLLFYWFVLAFLVTAYPMRDKHSKNSTAYKYTAKPKPVRLHVLPAVR